MPLIPTGAGQASVNFTGANVPNGATIVLGIGNGGGYTAVEAAEQVWNCFATFVPDVCSSDVALSSVDMKLGPNDTGPIATFSSSPVAGAVGGTSMSPGTAILIEKQTAIGGKHGRGRMYVPGVYDGWVDDAGQYVSGVYAQLVTFAETLFDDLVAADVSPYLLHSPGYTWRLTNGQPRRQYASLSTALLPTQCTAFVPDPMIATQRRRLR